MDRVNFYINFSSAVLIINALSVVENKYLYFILVIVQLINLIACTSLFDKYYNKTNIRTDMRSTQS